MRHGDEKRLKIEGGTKKPHLPKTHPFNLQPLKVEKVPGIC